MKRFITGWLSVLMLGALLFAPEVRAQTERPKPGPQFEKQLETLKSISEPTACQQATLIALEDEKVRGIVMESLENPCYVLKEICCEDRVRIPELEFIHFNFDCTSGCFCLVDPGFLVTVNVVEKKVTAVQRAYAGGEYPCRSLMSPGRSDSPQLASAGSKLMKVRTAWMSHPLEGAHRIFLVGHLTGPMAGGNLLLDPNVCGLDLFGDETICTLMAPRAMPVTFHQLKIKDPQGRGRAVYEIVPKSGQLANRLYVIVPHQLQDSWRLVSQDRSGTTRVITLENWDTPTTRDSETGDLVTLGNKDLPVLTSGVGSGWELARSDRLSAQQVPGMVLIKAEGTLPNPGYEVKFVRLPMSIWPPRHALMWKASSEPGIQPTQDYIVWTAFPAEEKIDVVTVVDSRGRREIHVEQVPDLTISGK